MILSSTILTSNNFRGRKSRQSLRMNSQAKNTSCLETAIAHKSPLPDS